MPQLRHRAPSWRELFRRRKAKSCPLRKGRLKTKELFRSVRQPLVLVPRRALPVHPFPDFCDPVMRQLRHEGHRVLTDVPAG